MEASGVVWLGAKLREESLKIRTRYKEWYGERNIVDLQRWILKNRNIYTPGITVMVKQAFKIVYVIKMARSIE